MFPLGLAVFHGLILGFTTLLGIGWCLIHFWHLHTNWPVIASSCEGTFWQRVALLALFAWLTTLTGLMLLAVARVALCPLFLWKAFSSLVAAGSLSLVAWTARRAGRPGLGRRFWRIRWLAGLALALLAMLLAALLGALSHYML